MSVRVSLCVLCLWLCVGCSGDARVCPAGFEGEACATDVDDCAPDPCLNGGTCSDGVDGFTCACPAGFEGEVCTTNVDDCDPDPCLNGGTCSDGVDGFTCACPAGFQGEVCATNVDDCDPDPCLNGGTCSDGVDGFTCACPAGFQGKLCQTDGDDCAAAPCAAVGWCVDGVDSYTCTPVVVGIWGDDETGGDMLAPIIDAMGLDTEAWPGAIDSAESVAVSADGDHVAFHQGGNIHVRQLSTGVLTRITDAEEDPSNPSAGGDVLVWTEKRGGSRGVYGYRLSTGVEQTLSLAGESPGSVRTDGATAVWLNSVALKQVVGFDFATSTRFVIHETTENIPDGVTVAGNVVVWRNFDSSSTVWAAELAPGAPPAVARVFPVAEGLGSTFGATAYDNVVMFIRRTGLEDNVWLYDLASDTSRPLTPAGGWAIGFHRGEALWRDDASGGHPWAFDLSRLGEEGYVGREVMAAAFNGMAANDDLVIGRSGDGLEALDVSAGTVSAVPQPGTLTSPSLQLAVGGATVAWSATEAAGVDEVFAWTAGAPAAVEVSGLVTHLVAEMRGSDVLVVGEARRSAVAAAVYEAVSGQLPGLLLMGTADEDDPLAFMLSDAGLEPFTYDYTDCGARFVDVVPAEAGHAVFAGLDTSRALDLATADRGTVFATTFGPPAPPESPPSGWTVLATWSDTECFAGEPAIVEYATAGGTKVILDGALSQANAYVGYSADRLTLLHNTLLYLGR